MASLKRIARRCSIGVEAKKEVNLIDSVLEMSVTVGYLGADVKPDELDRLQILIKEHCVAGVASLERGDLENHLHFHMVVRSHYKSARSFGILVRKYMGWYGRKGMNPVGKVMCKVLTNRMIHTFKGMIGYCLKDSGVEHFQTVLFNISDDDVTEGKRLHIIYGRADLKGRVTLINKNIMERMYVWYMYKTNRRLRAIFLNTLTDMIQSGMFIPAAGWIIPLAGQGMDYIRISALFKCMIDPVNVCLDDVQHVFVRKRQYVRGRYFDDEVNMLTRDRDPLEKDPVPIVSVEKEKSSFVPITPSYKLAPEEKSPLGVKYRALIPREAPILKKRRRVLFEDSEEEEKPKKILTYEDTLGDYVPLKELAPLPKNVYFETLEGIGVKDKLERSLTHANIFTYTNTIERHAGKKDGECSGSASNQLIILSSDSDPDDMSTATEKLEEEPLETEIIVLSSDSEGEDTPLSFEIGQRQSAVHKEIMGNVKIEPGLHVRSHVEEYNYHVWQNSTIDL